MKHSFLVCAILSAVLAILKLMGVFNTWKVVLIPVVVFIVVGIGGYILFRNWLLNGEGSRLSDGAWDADTIKDILQKRERTMQDEKVRDSLIRPAYMSGVKYFGDIYEMGIFYRTVNNGIGWCRNVSGEVWLYIMLADTGKWCKFRRATTAEIDGAYESALPNEKQVELLRRAVTC